MSQQPIDQLPRPEAGIFIETEFMGRLRDDLASPYKPGLFYDLSHDFAEELAVINEDKASHLTTFTDCSSSKPHLEQLFGHDKYGNFSLSFGTDRTGSEDRFMWQLTLAQSIRHQNASPFIGRTIYSLAVSSEESVLRRLTFNTAGARLSRETVADLSVVRAMKATVCDITSSHELAAQICEYQRTSARAKIGTQTERRRRTRLAGVHKFIGFVSMPLESF